LHNQFLVKTNTVNLSIAGSHLSGHHQRGIQAAKIKMRTVNTIDHS